MKSGIYIITNKVNGKQYVGLSSNIKRRWSEHKTPKNTNKTTLIAKAFRKYGIDSFSFEVLEICAVEILAEREIFWIEKLSPAYNMNNGGEGNNGRSMPDETRLKISQKLKKRWEQLPMVEKLKISKRLETKKGHHVSHETKSKLSIASTGKKQSIETLEIRSNLAKSYMIGNANASKAVAKVKDGKVVETFESSKIAAQSINVHPSCITRALKSNGMSGGFAWCLVDAANEFYHTLKL